VPRGGATPLHDAVELIALQEDHLARQATVAVDPVPHRGRVDMPQSASTRGAGHWAAVAVRHPGGVKAEARARGRAELVVRDHAQHQRAGRQAIAVDDDTLAARAQHGEGFQVMPDLAAAILGDAHLGRCRRHAGYQQGGT